MYYTSTTPVPTYVNVIFHYQFFHSRDLRKKLIMILLRGKQKNEIGDPSRDEKSVLTNQK